MSTPMPDAAIREFLEREYLPEGYRAQLMVGYPGQRLFEDAAVEAVERRGLDPARRVAHMNPRPGEQAVRDEDLLEFIQKYGHEYAAGLLAANSVEQVRSITAAARAVGFAILWDVSTLEPVSAVDVADWGIVTTVSVSPQSGTISLI